MITLGMMYMWITGSMLMRFDDTNPSKEKDEYVENILNDVKTMGIEYVSLSYTSDNFDLYFEKAETMLAKGTHHPFCHIP